MAIPLVVKTLKAETDSGTTNTATPEDALISKLEAAHDQLENRLDPAVDITLRDSQNTRPTYESESKKEQIRQETLGIVGDGDVDDLSEDERERVEELREQYIVYDSIQSGPHASPTPDHPVLFVEDTPDGSAETIAAAVFDPLEPLDLTMFVNGSEVTPFTETELAEAIAIATPPPTL